MQAPPPVELRLAFLNPWAQADHNLSFLSAAEQRSATRAAHFLEMPALLSSLCSLL